MTLIKSLLLGSAAGLVAVASAQAADLPTKKGAPAAEYVKVCKLTVGGVPFVGFTIPGSDTCLKISGLVTAQATVGNNAPAGSNTIGLFARGRIALDAVSNTAAGPLVSHIDTNIQNGAGFDSAANGFANLDNAYLQWAGLTAGQHGSFFDFFAGGPAWDDFISPDHTGTGTLLFAYTASLGGGFSATLSAEVPQLGYDVANAPARTPDWVINLTEAQGWGKVQLSAVAHDAYYVTTKDTWGFGVLGGVKVNIPGLAGSDFGLQAVYTKDAVAYSGLGSPGGFYYTGNGPLGLQDLYLNKSGNDSTAWSVAAAADFAINPQFTISPELSYGSLSYANGPSETEFVGGGTFGWTPVTNLTFNLDLLYVTGTANHVDFSGFNGKLRIERDF